jgi:hypothetical protein
LYHLTFNRYALTIRERLGLLERFEWLLQRIAAAERSLINSLARQATPEVMGEPPTWDDVTDWRMDATTAASQGPTPSGAP